MTGKTGRPRLANPMIHTAIVLSRDMREQIVRATETSGRSMSGEIRHRLQQSLDGDRDMTMGANKPHRSLGDCPTRQGSRYQWYPRFWRALNTTAWVAVTVIIFIAMVASVGGCTKAVPSPYTEANPPPYTDGECWVLKHDGRWYDCRA